ncbi:MAG TPA: methylmalonyl Co-A mutase-associated GTPase MeaB [Lacibacter sp.]|nr:methylmalonyl Co-A mutase-associated GTPase MeaB [Lacibacter sp.]HMO88424.1 methylmalonyl Co-A mutase-associated GTPase MeaB [Lacibacter sp.]HMP85890.1 methylmalonyl Co-A mutase-associated GTPase MeaB [Lacibacter sp.]
MWQPLLQGLLDGDTKSLARCISLVENEVPGTEAFLQQLPASSVPVIGLTGPPGAGKSTLVDALLKQLVTDGKKAAVLCVDPSSPFNLGAVLGDRIRMSDWYNHPNVFIRSLATRGSLGGLHPKILEITDVCKAAGFDYVIVETVGVGQSEIEITGLADVTVVVLVPEAGDEIQTMKAGLMEIADLFVINKADRPDADRFVHNLRLMMPPARQQERGPVPIVKTVALRHEGTAELWNEIRQYLALGRYNERRPWLLAEKAFQLIQHRRMKDVNKAELKDRIATQLQEPGFNLYRFVAGFASPAGT